MTKHTNILGVDPGLKGGYALVRTTEGVLNPQLLMCDSLPVRGKFIDVQALHDATEPMGVDLFVLEKVGPHGKDGVASMFTFGAIYGMLLGAAVAYGWPTVLVRPQEWKKLVLTGTKRTKTDACVFASLMFPNINLRPGRCRVDHDGLAEAACLAEWGRLYLQGRTLG